jgi:glycosyltransferase involved in cell wall biosynthesis
MINGKPIVSIITPSYNRADIVHETAESIFKQSYSYWEWVIVDDGSTDNSWQVLESFAARDNRVKIFKRDREPKGACACRNIAVQKSSGVYLIFLDTDDLITSFCIEQRMQAALQYPDCDFVIFPMLLFKKKPDDMRVLWNIDKDKDDIDRLFFGDAICQGTGTLWKKSSFIEIGMWDERLLLWQDVELHLRSLIQGLKYKKCLHLRPDTFLRVSDVSLSRTGYHSLPKLQSRLRVLKETINAISDKGKFIIYCKGLRFMFIDLFLNAAKGRHSTVAQELFAITGKYPLFTEGEVRNMKKFLTVYRFRMYKIPGLNGRLTERIATMEKAPQATLGTQPYEDKIVL